MFKYWWSCTQNNNASKNGSIHRNDRNFSTEEGKIGVPNEEMPLLENCDLANYNITYEQTAPDCFNFWGIFNWIQTG